jgi:hypothetical protein
MSNLEARQTAFAAEFGLSYEQYKKLATACNSTELVTCLELLKAKKHRSAYRATLAASVRAWLVEDIPVHAKPLSFYQFRNAEPKWPVHYNFPT